MRYLVILIAFFLGGCTTIPAAMTVIAKAHKSALEMKDKDMAAQVSRSQGAVSLRVGELWDKPLTLKAMHVACRQGRFVELITHVNEAPSISAEGKPCYQVFLSHNPDLPMSQDILVVGGTVSMIHGQTVFLSPQENRRYYSMLAGLKSQSYHIR